MENGIISQDHLQEQINMLKRKEVLNRHKHKITNSPDGKWRTYVPADTKTKLKLIVKKSKEELEDFIYQYYIEREENYNPNDKYKFSDIYKQFRSFKELVVSDNTIYKYDCDYKRFFASTPLESMKIISITEEDCIQFIVDRIRTLQLNKKAYESLYAYLNGVFKYAKNKHIISDNPMEYIERKQYFRYCIKNVTNPTKRIISSAEMNTLNSQMQYDHEHRPRMITTFAVEFARLTGMRVGEIAALSWDKIDFDNKVITVDCAEVYHFKTAKSTIESTKNGVVRYIPITDDIKNLLDDVAATEEKFGFKGKYVFSNYYGRITKNAIGHCARSLSKRSGLTNVKSIHSYRRTLNSKLKSMGMTTETAASLLGHSTEVNINNYTYDITDFDYKRECLDKAQKF